MGKERQIALKTESGKSNSEKHDNEAKIKSVSEKQQP